MEVPICPRDATNYVWLYNQVKKVKIKEKTNRTQTQEFDFKVANENKQAKQVLGNATVTNALS